ncbi:MAG: hypothetical protein NC453_10670 [Muribaculum sp.]|nr:hypothetical protein [Muribaculum sp.]
MRKYIVFEGGSRAGLSAELFFHAWRKQNGWNEGEGDVLYLADSDPVFRSVPTSSANIKRITEQAAFSLIQSDENVVVFPADELTRQCNFAVNDKVSEDKFAGVSQLWYDKAHMNNVLSELVSTANCAIRIPLTFGLTHAFIKPNRASAGSKGIELKEEVCVSQPIEIEHEYVVDVLRSDNRIEAYPREVVLRAGYDKYVRLLPTSSPLAREVCKFVECVGSQVGLFAPGIFHIQLAEDVNGDLYYIEASRRISGTSIVNLANGFNPFCFMNGVVADALVHRHKYGEWFRYEDSVLDVENVIRSII